MGLFSSRGERDEVKRVERMAEKTAKDIRRVEQEDLVRIKRRQDAIERRLSILQQELDVQMRNQNA
jgi:hypothetical protein